MNEVNKIYFTTYRFLVAIGFGQHIFQPVPLLLWFTALAARQSAGRAAALVHIRCSVAVDAITPVMTAMVITIIVFVAHAGALSNGRRMRLSVSYVVSHEIGIQHDNSKATLRLFDSVISAYWWKSQSVEKTKWPHNNQDSIKEFRHKDQSITVTDTYCIYIDFYYIQRSGLSNEVNQRGLSVECSSNRALVQLIRLCLPHPRWFFWCVVCFFLPEQ